MESRGICLALVVFVVSVSCVPVPEGAGTKTGALGGALVGGAAGGKLGAVAGAGVGALAGHEIHKANKNADQANARVKREGAGTKTGALGGAVAGGVVGGPIGAAVGAGVGALAGHEIHKANKHADQANVNAAAASGQPVVVDRTKREGAGTKTGALGGAVAGGVVGGPIGAAVGAGVGALAGHEIHKANKHADQANVNAAAASGQPVVVDRTKREGAGTKTGALGGAIVGGLAGGPIGAAVGAGVGALAGHELHKANKHANEANINAAVANGQPVVVDGHHNQRVIV